MNYLTTVSLLKTGVSISLSLVVNIGFSQSTEQNVISSSGNHYENGTAQFSYTIGETVISTVSNPSNTLTQGFHQTNWNFVGLEDLSPEVLISVFPNPILDELTIKTENNQNMKYQIFDAAGNLIFEGQIISSTTQIDTQSLTPASYSLRILNDNLEKMKIFKLIKSH